METSSYFSVLQRRWPLVLACLAIGLLAGLILTPSDPKGTGNQWTSSVNVVPAPNSAKEFNLAPVQLMTDGGEVARRVAKRLNNPDPAVLASKVTSQLNPDLGLVQIAAKAPSRKAAEDLATAWAQETVAAFGDSQRKTRQGQADSMTGQLDKLKTDIDGLEKSTTNAPVGKKATLQAEFDAKRGQYTTLVGQQQELVNPLNDPKVEVMDGLKSTPDSTTSILAPTSRPLRIGLAAALGLALGLIAALMVDRMDVRLRGRIQLEDAFGLPVIAEVPRATRRQRAGHAVLVAGRPDSPVAEAYRTLRSALLLSGPPGLAYRLSGTDPRQTRATAMPVRRISDPAPVILVVSPRPGDGRTSTVANLAAALAEAGRSVLVLDCDFRNPATHLYLGAKPGKGMSEVLLAEQEIDLQDVVRGTDISNVRVITAGAPAAYPAALLLRAGEVVQRARHHADVVLVDSAPLLYANDTNDLVQHADAMLVVARSGNLTADQASRVGELLTRTGVPIAGVVLLGVDPQRSMGGGLKRGPRTGPVGRIGSTAGLVLRGRSAEASPVEDEDAERPAPSWAKRRELGEGEHESPQSGRGTHRADSLPSAEDSADPGFRVQSASERALRNGAGDGAHLGPHFDTWSTVELGSEDR
ncbi:CpsD/CapB family tyrosine-protein kinase [Embleya scabrispora]|uniref:CpsD/CapB family tyrosine-protein kinase n=1 Tax=Embleya scabrispora TaxID=159449 RepID=UPI0003A2E5A9|nr:CpsD/CapB family tyrosine-protein kinase [Embleya scabrispora]MYS78695.1 AAA family ATPase [Streptomyces sp. SID5474]